MNFDPGMLVIFIVSFIFSTTFHEASHAWTALRLGDPTAYRGGQVTLNPWPHIRREPIGMVVVPLLFFALTGYMVGWASAPIDPYWAHANPHRSARVSWAGPLANLVLALAGTAMLYLLQSQAGLLAFAQGNLGEGLLIFLQVLTFQNLLLFTFNLLPLPPLDGAEGILLFFPEAKADAIRTGMRAIGWFGLLLAMLLFRKIFPLIFAFWDRTFGVF